MELSNKSYLVSMNYPLQLSLTQGELEGVVKVLARAVEI